MEKYTDLEQAVLDSSLAIITDRITTQKELNRVFFRYKVLPRRQRRYSDYYSNRFFGHTVPEMYVRIKDQLKADNYTFDDSQLPNEKYMLSEPDLYYKKDSFNSGETNLCFIIGHSGSGKSMMARTLEGEDIDHIELDDLLLTADHFTMDELQEYSDLFYAFFTGEGAKYYIGVGERDSIPKEEYEDRVFIDFVKFAMDYTKQHPEKKYIIDGIWIYLYFDDPSLFEDYAVFIKGTSFLKSKIRTIKREMQRDKETLQDRKQMFGREVRNYLLDEDKINRFRIYFGDRPETVLKAETNESANKDEAVVRELRNINSCFVDDDADGITRIMKQAEEDPELSGWNKMRIINECRAALFDLAHSPEKPAKPEPDHHTNEAGGERKMEMIQSFSVDHTRIVPGIFTSRVDHLGEYSVTTYDIRVRRPNVEPAIDILAMHSLEHIIATYLRNDPEWKDEVIYWGPMGCLTGFYLILKGDRSPRELYPLLLGAFRAVKDTEEVPGTSPENCGYYRMHNLEMAKWYADHFVSYLEANAKNSAIFEYPRTERLVTDDGQNFYDS